MPVSFRDSRLESLSNHIQCTIVSHSFSTFLLVFSCFPSEDADLRRSRAGPNYTRRNFDDCAVAAIAEGASIAVPQRMGSAGMVSLETWPNSDIFGPFEHRL